VLFSTKFIDNFRKTFRSERHTRSPHIAYNKHASGTRICAPTSIRMFSSGSSPLRSLRIDSR
jgi:hypothetical protein